MTRASIATAAALALLLAAPALEAQTSTDGQHGVTGPPTTTGDIAGGAFSPGTDPVVATPAIAAAIGEAATAVTADLTAGTATDATGNPIPVEAQTAVLWAMQGDAASLAAVVDAIGVAEAAALAESLDGLLSNPQPGQLAQAVSDFNSVIDAASADFLANPPAEFLAVHAALDALTTAGIAAGV
jgi:hypothetical protein